MSDESIKAKVRETYGGIATADTAGCGCGCAPVSSCYGPTDQATEASRAIGYSDAEMTSVPDGANLGLGCGNPLALDSLKPGEVVLDLGSGAGFDAFLAAPRVGETGRVIGVDMTAAMLDKARANAATGGYNNVEFRLGEIEHLPVADNSVDAITSNCVINLVSDKNRAFAEAFRVLKPGGRLMVHDIVLQAALPPVIRDSVNAYVGCIAGAMLKDDYLAAIRGAGFTPVEVREEQRYPLEDVLTDPVISQAIRQFEIAPELALKAANSVLSVGVFAVKPV